MGTTTKWKLPYPEPTDPVAGGADAIKALANALDPRLSGTVARYEWNTLPDIAAASTGTRDVATFGAGLTQTVPMIVIARLFGYGGFAGAACTFGMDIVPLISGSPVGDIARAIGAPAAQWAAAGVVAIWTVPANGEVRWKVRHNYISGTGTCHSGGTIETTVLVS